MVCYFLKSFECHSGVLAGGHYISYGKTDNGKWFCQNDSACKVSQPLLNWYVIKCFTLSSFSQEIPEDQIDKSTAYMLFYEREDLSVEDYLPKFADNVAVPDTKDLDEELETDFKKQCSVMWTHCDTKEDREGIREELFRSLTMMPILIVKSSTSNSQESFHKIITLKWRSASKLSARERPLSCPPRKRLKIETFQIYMQKYFLISKCNFEMQFSSRLLFGTIASFF